MFVVGQGGGFGEASLVALLVLLSVAACPPVDAVQPCLRNISADVPRVVHVPTQNSSGQLTVCIAVLCDGDLPPATTIAYSLLVQQLGAPGPVIQPMTVETGNTTTVVIGDLASAVEYVVSAQWVINSTQMLESPPTIIRVPDSTIPMPSSAPVDVAIPEQTTQTIVVTYRPPLRPNSPIVRYRIIVQNLRNLSIANLTLLSGELMFQVSDLMPDTRYSVTVEAANQAGADAFGLASIPYGPASSPIVTTTRAQATQQFLPLTIYVGSFGFSIGTGLTQLPSTTLGVPPTGMAYAAWNYLYTGLRLGNNIFHVLYIAQINTQTFASQILVAVARTNVDRLSFPVMPLMILPSHLEYSALEYDWINRLLYFCTWDATASMAQVIQVTSESPVNFTGAVQRIYASNFTGRIVDTAIDPVHGYFYLLLEGQLGIRRVELGDGAAVSSLLMAFNISSIQLDLENSRMLFVTNFTIWSLSLQTMAGPPEVLFPAFRNVREFAEYSNFLAWFHSNDDDGSQIGDTLGTGSGSQSLIAGSGQGSSQLKLFRAGLQPRPIPESAVQSLEVLVTATSASLSWSPPSTTGFGSGSFQTWSYRVTVSEPANAQATDICEVVVLSTATSSVQFTLNTTLMADTRYGFQVNAYDTVIFSDAGTRPCDGAVDGRFGPASRTVQVTTLRATDVPPAVLTADGVNGLQYTSTDGAVRQQLTSSPGTPLAIGYDLRNGSIIWASQESGVASVSLQIQGNPLVALTSANQSMPVALPASLSAAGVSPPQAFTSFDTNGASPPPTFRMAVDYIGGRVFWTTGFRINFAQYDQVSPVQTLAASAGNIVDLALDVVGGYIYWINGNLFSFARTNTDYCQTRANQITILSPRPTRVFPGEFLQSLYHLPALERLFFVVQIGSQHVLRYGIPQPATGFLDSIQTIYTSSTPMAPISSFGSKIFFPSAGGRSISVVDDQFSSAVPPYLAQFSASATSTSFTDVTLLADDAQPFGAASCLMNLPDGARPTAPANLRIDLAQSSAVHLTIVWDPSVALCAGQAISYNLDFSTAAPGTDLPVVPALSCPVQLSNSSYTITGLMASTRVEVRSLQAFSTWLPSAAASATFFSFEEAPREAPINPRLFYACTATLCQVTFRWSEIAVAAQNGNITAYHVRWGQVGQTLQNVTVIDNLTFSVGALLVGQTYSFEVRGVNSAGNGPFSPAVQQLFAANGAVAVPLLVTTSGSMPGSISLFDVDVGTFGATPLVPSNDVIIADPAVRLRYEVQFIEYAARSDELFWVAAIPNLAWTLRYQITRMMSVQRCNLRSNPTGTANQALNVAGTTFDWIGRVFYMVAVADGRYTVEQIFLPSGDVCSGQLRARLLDSSNFVTDSLVLSQVSGVLFYLKSNLLRQISVAEGSTVATPVDPTPAVARRRKRQLQLAPSGVIQFNTTSLHFSPLENVFYVAIKSPGPLIYRCPDLSSSAMTCQQFVVDFAGPTVDNLYSDATFLYWTTTADSTLVFYQRLTAFPSSVGMGTTRKGASTPIVAFGTQLQPLPPQNCLQPPDNSVTRSPPIRGSISATTVTITVPTPTLTAACRALTSSLAPSSVTVRHSLRTGSAGRTVTSPTASVLVDSLLPATTYNLSVVSFENIFGRTPITMAEFLTFTTDEAAPSAPLDVMATAIGPDAISINFTAPLQANGELTGYRIMVTPSAGPEVNVTVTGDVSEVTVTHLQPSVVYSIMVFASTVQEGVGSSPVTATTMQAPQEIREVASRSGSADFNCTNLIGVTCVGMFFTCLNRPRCTMPSCVNSQLQASTIESTSRVYRVTGLEGEVVYSITTQYSYPNGYLFATTRTMNFTAAATVPDALTGLDVVTRDNNFVFSWATQSCFRDNGVVSYQLNITLSTGEVVVEANVQATPVSTGRLQVSFPQNADYRTAFAVASNSLGFGPISNVVNVTVGTIVVTGDSSVPLGLIVGAACGGAVLLIALIVITIACLRASRRKKNRQPIMPHGFLMNNFAENTFYETIDIDEDLKQYEISSDLVRVEEQIGKGHFGVVKRGWYMSKPGAAEMQVAIKTLNAGAPREGQSEFMEEAKIMLDMEHPHILRCFGICIHERLWLVMEYCQGGNLLGFLEACKHQLEEGVVLSVLDVVNMMEDIAEGMGYLEQQHKVHRDLAARNVLIANDPRSPNRMLKISDFGLTRDNYTEEYIMDLTARDKALPVRWVAPESMMDGVFNSKTDVWSFGVVMWELGSLGELPYGSFRDVRSIIDEVKRGLKIRRPPYFTDEMYRIMQAAMHYRPDRRANFSQLLTMIQQYKNSISDCMTMDVFMMQRFTFNPRSPDDYFSAEETGELELEVQASNSAAALGRAGSLRNSIRALRTSLRSRQNVEATTAAAAVAGGGATASLTNLDREARLSSKRDRHNQYVGDIKRFEGDDLKGGHRVDISSADGPSYSHPSADPASSYSFPRAQPDSTYSHPRPDPDSSFSHPRTGATQESYSSPRSSAAATNGAAGGSRGAVASAVAPADNSRGRLQSEVPVNYNWPSSDPRAPPKAAASATYSNPRPADGSSSTAAFTASAASAAASVRSPVQSEVPVDYSWPSSDPAPSAAAARGQGRAGRLVSTNSVELVPAPWMSQDDMQRAGGRPEPRPRTGTRPQASPRGMRSHHEPSLEETAAGNAEYSNKFISGVSVKKAKGIKPPPPQRRETLQAQPPAQATTGGVPGANGVANGSTYTNVRAHESLSSPPADIEFEMNL